LVPDAAEDIRRQQFGTLLRLSPQAIVILDADGRIQEWNPAAVALLGWTREELVGQALAELLGEQDRTSFSRAWAELQAKGAAASISSEGLHHERPAVPL
jgi:PAS domain S-box-containing protein